MFIRISSSDPFIVNPPTKIIGLLLISTIGTQFSTASDTINLPSYDCKEVPTQTIKSI